VDLLLQITQISMTSVARYPSAITYLQIRPPNIHDNVVPSGDLVGRRELCKLVDGESGDGGLAGWETIEEVGKGGHVVVYRSERGEGRPRHRVVDQLYASGCWSQRPTTGCCKWRSYSISSGMLSLVVGFVCNYESDSKTRLTAMELVAAFEGGSQEG
jgi:hypothetical protein